MPLRIKTASSASPPVRGEPPARERLLQLLASAFGDAWNNDVLTKLLAEAGSPSLDGLAA